VDLAITPVWIYQKPERVRPQGFTRESEAHTLQNDMELESMSGALLLEDLQTFLSAFKEVFLIATSEGLPWVFVRWYLAWSS
jgi:hypothetical protein